MPLVLCLWEYFIRAKAGIEEKHRARAGGSAGRQQADDRCAKQYGPDDSMAAVAGLCPFYLVCIRGGGSRPLRIQRDVLFDRRFEIKRIFEGQAYLCGMNLKKLTGILNRRGWCAYFIFPPNSCFSTKFGQQKKSRAQPCGLNTTLSSG